MQAMNNSAIRDANRRLVAQTIFRNPNITQAQLLRQTQLSNHTLITIIRELEQADIIQRGQPQESTGGRPPISLMIRADSRYALGASVDHDDLIICLTDFCGTIVDLRRYDITPFRAEPAPREFLIEERCFTEFLPKCAKEILRINEIPAEKVLGFALNVKGWIEDRYWHCGSGRYYVPNICHACEEQLGFPFLISRDDVTVGLSESWFLNQRSMLSLMLDDGIGGIMITDGRINIGTHGRAGSFGHITLHPGGKPCVCGKTGCFGVYCSSFALLSAAFPDLHTFFSAVEAGDAEAVAQLETYLDNLSIGISNLAAMTDRPIVISGQMAGWLEPYLPQLKQHFSDAFPVEVQLGKLRTNASAIAAACHQLQRFFTAEI